MPDTVVDFVLHRIDTVTWLALSGPIKKERSIAEHRLGPEAGPDGQETLSRRTACHNLGCPSKLLEIISNTNHIKYKSCSHGPNSQETLFYRSA